MISSLPSSNTNRARILFICMILSLATSRQLIVSSHPLAPFVNGVRLHQRRCRHRHRRSRFAFASNISPPRVASLPHGHNIARYHPLYERSMSPPNGISSISSISMSAIEEIPSSDSSSPDKNIVSPTQKAMIARRVSAALPSLDRCGARLRSGGLVAFPTETVYGLGCHALDPVAVQKVFDAKERPLSDPLIVHVTRTEDALGLWDASSPAGSAGPGAGDDAGRDVGGRGAEGRALRALAGSFFPGPLTLVARALPSVPGILMAGTGYVACRSPSHPVARALIDAAGVPIAAPSANKFGHVSPTSAGHVLDDLGGEDVWVVEPADDGATAGGGNAVCQVGVESTVAKVEMDPDPSSSSEVVGNITILRHGAISSRSIRAALEEADLSRYFVVSDSVGFTSEETRNVAPGQTIRHYSPNVPCFMVDPSRQSPPGGGGREPDEGERATLSRSAIVDYGGRLAGYRSHALSYRDLSPSGDSAVAASCLFEALRWSEAVEGATRVFVPELVLGDDGREGGHEALVLAVKDKLTRASSAVVVDVFR